MSAELNDLGAEVHGQELSDGLLADMMAEEESSMIRGTGMFMGLLDATVVPLTDEEFERQAQAFQEMLVEDAS